MKNSIKWSLVAILSTILIAGASCEKSIDDEGGSKYYEYFLSTYQSMDLALETGLEDEQGKIYSIQIGSGENVQFFTSPDYPNPSHVAQFLKIAARNGDTDFKRMDNSTSWNSRMALSDNLVSIHITSNNDWDETHPAGTPLDDLFEITMNSFTEFIRNGYAFESTSPQPDPVIRGARKIVKPVSELTPDELAIIQRDPLFIVLSTPTLAEEHTLTFTLTNTNGKEYILTKTVKPTRPDWLTENTSF